MLFANILAVSQHPDDATKLQVLKDNIQKHFDFEEQRFCNVEHYNCVDHKAKHYKHNSSNSSDSSNSSTSSNSSN